MTTRLPWNYEKVSRFDECDILGADGKTVALIYSSDGMDDATDLPAEANAALIVRAVNSLASNEAKIDALTKALQKLMKAVNFRDAVALDADQNPMMIHDAIIDIEHAMKLARAALSSHTEQEGK